MKTIRSLIIALILTAGSVYVAHAQTRFHVSVNTPGLHVSAGNTHHYYHRGYYAPAYHHYYHRTYYAPVVYHHYYHRTYYQPVYRHTYYRHVYTHPVYHHVYYRR